MPRQNLASDPPRQNSGHIGYPQVASVDKGEALLRVFTARVVALLERVIAWDRKE